jgi:hypothetical protein
LKSANNWLKDFLIDSLNFLTFNTNDKPFPFKNKVEAEAEPEADEKVIDAEVEELDADEPSSKEPN